MSVVLITIGTSQISLIWPACSPLIDAHYGYKSLAWRCPPLLHSCPCGLHSSFNIPLKIEGASYSTICANYCQHIVQTTCLRLSDCPLKERARRMQGAPCLTPRMGAGTPLLLWHCVTSWPLYLIHQLNIVIPQCDETTLFISIAGIQTWPLP